MKKCNKCAADKDDFNKSKAAPDGLQSTCRQCQKQYRIDNQERLDVYFKEYRENNVEAKTAYLATYYSENRNEINKKHRIYYAKNKDKILEKQSSRKDLIAEYQKEYRKEYYTENRNRIKDKVNFRYRNDSAYRAKVLLRGRFRNWFKSMGMQKTGHVADLIGCTFEELCKHLESQFKPGMTWDNQGDWHIDHIKPLALFDPLNSDHLKEAWHYTNLQPLWAVENWIKGDRI